MSKSSPALRVGNCSGFYGDRLTAMREMLEGGSLDVLTGDYLAELTMLILFRSTMKDPTKGYATTFLRQLEDCLGLAGERGVRIVVNAGGLNPTGCADAVRALAGRLGLDVPVASVAGSVPREALGELDPAPVTVDPYLGCWGIVDALSAGATVVVTGRTTDAALVCGPAAWHHGWARDDWDALAGAVVAGHVLECGAQATGGNYAFFAEVPGLDRVGFPLAEIAADGSSVITKHPGTGGLVSVGTVTAQLLYEIDSPAYLGPDVVARFDTIELKEDGPDRVRVAGVRGAPPPATVKVSTNSVGGFRNSMSFVLCGLDIPAKAEVAKAAMASVLDGVRGVQWQLVRLDQPDAPSEEQASALLRCHVKDSDGNRIGRMFSSAAVEMALASYPGFTLTSPPGDATPYGVYRPVFVDAGVVTHTVTRPDGSQVRIAATLAGQAPQAPGPQAPGSQAPAPPTPTQQARALAADSAASPAIRVPLGLLAGARSGDKGGMANLGIWTRTEEPYAWLVGYLTTDRLVELLPEARGLSVRRYELPNLRALNFTLDGLLGEGVAASTRFDPQAKALGEWLRSRLVDVPAALVPPS